MEKCHTFRQPSSGGLALDDDDNLVFTFKFIGYCCLLFFIFSNAIAAFLRRIPYFIPFIAQGSGEIIIIFS